MSGIRRIAVTSAALLYSSNRVCGLLEARRLEVWRERIAGVGAEREDEELMVYRPFSYLSAISHLPLSQPDDREALAIRAGAALERNWLRFPVCLRSLGRTCRAAGSPQPWQGAKDGSSRQSSHGR